MFPSDGASESVNVNLCTWFPSTVATVTPSPTVTHSPVMMGGVNVAAAVAVVLVLLLLLVVGVTVVVVGAVLYLNKPGLCYQ